MKKIVLIFGMVLLLFGVISIATAPAVSAVSDDPAEYDSTDSMVEEATDGSEEEIYVETEGDLPQEDILVEEGNANDSEEITVETDEESAMEETEETEETEVTEE